MPEQSNSGTGTGWSRIRWVSMIAPASFGITSLYTQRAPFGRRFHHQPFITGIRWFRRRRPHARRSLGLCRGSRSSCLNTSKDEDRMDVKTAIQNGDVGVLRELLAEDRSRANELIRWGGIKPCLTHPLHFVSDMLFGGKLAKGKEIPLADALIEAGADVDFHRDREDSKKSETPLIGAASLGAEDLGIRLLDTGARPELRGLFGETALHWAAMLGEDRLTARLIEGSDLNLKDEQYQSPPLGWAIHGRFNPPAGNHGKQHEVAALLVRAGAIVETEWLASEEVRTDATMLTILSTGMRP
jgi:hypothetical protein